MFGALAVAGQGNRAGAQAPSTETVVAENDRWVVPQRQMDEGATFLFDNNDPGIAHNVTAKARGPDGRRLFRSRTFVGRTQDRPVAGTEYLPAGTYGFICTVHPFTMDDGVLTVREFGDGPVPRPRVRVAIASSRLAQVVRSRRLTVAVRAGQPTSPRVELVARRGKRLIAKRRRLDLEPGQRRMVGMKLTRRGRTLLAGRNRARVTVTGRVDFGSPSRAIKRLR